jgi:hypothetical protein
MSCVMENEFGDVEIRFEQLDGTRLNAQEVGSGLPAIAVRP